MRRLLSGTLLGLSVGIAWLPAIPSANAAPIFLGGVGAAAVVDQHPLARPGENTYDTILLATGIYNRQVDVVGQRYDFFTDYFPLISGDWYCTPTSALSLISYWDQRPVRNFPNLLVPGDTARSVILQVASSMDTDDLAVAGPADFLERHLGTRVADIDPGLLAYFNGHYPGVFGAFDLSVAGVGGFNDFGNLYDGLIRANIPVILNFPGHSTVGVGFDPAFAANNANHYIVNDPWNAAQGIAGGAVGLGRPILANVVFGGLASDLYGPSVDTYLTSPRGSGNLPVSMQFVAPVPEPATFVMVCVGLVGLALFRCRKRSARFAR